MLPASKMKSRSFTRRSFSVWPRPPFPVSAPVQSLPGLWPQQQLSQFSANTIDCEPPALCSGCSLFLEWAFLLAAGRMVALFRAQPKCFLSAKPSLPPYTYSRGGLTALCVNTCLEGITPKNYLSAFIQSVILSTVMLQ